MAVEEGKKAPAFALNDQDGETVKLSDLAGQWAVLYFYPRDDTPGCTIEACDFTSSLKAFEKLGATVYGCSPDSIESHQKFIKKFKLKVGLLSDPTHKMMEKYSAWGEKNMYGKKSMGIQRSTFLIDTNGRVVKRWRRVKVDGHDEQVLAALKEMKQV